MSEATSGFLNKPIRSLAEVRKEREAAAEAQSVANSNWMATKIGPPTLDTPERFAKRTRHLGTREAPFESLWAKLNGWPK